MVTLEGRTTLVTGGAGFYGTHLVDELLEYGARVTVVDCVAANMPVARPEVELITADLRSPEMQSLLADRRFDLLFHLAGNSSVRCWLKNLCRTSTRTSESC